jgi:hypothetical protein
MTVCDVQIGTYTSQKTLAGKLPCDCPEVSETNREKW